MGQWRHGTKRVAPARALAAAAFAACLALPAAAAAQIPGAPVQPIPNDPGNGNINDFVGANAAAHEVTAQAIPQNPFMATNGRNNLHDDGYMTDTYTLSGPMTDGAEISSLFLRECASVLFDSQGRIVTICVGLDRPVLALIHPYSLQVLAAMQLPVRNLQSGSNPFNDFSGGGYFYLDNQDRAILGTNDRHVLEVAIGSGPSFVTTRDVDLSQEIPANDGIISVLPDWKGRLWFVTRLGLVGTIDRASGAVRARKLSGEGISNSFAVDETGGVFIVSDKALYRFDAGDQGEPKETWRIVYPNSGIRKPSQSDAGSGTTPTLMGKGNKGWVAITDNADPMNVQVYRRAATLAPKKKKKRRKKRRKKPPAAAAAKKKGKKKRRKKARVKARQVCSEPVFRRGASATDNTLIGTDKSLIVENNYGYSGITATMNGGVTEPGVARIDVEKMAIKRPKKKKKKKKKKTQPTGTAAKKKRKKKRKPVTTYRCKTVWTSQERAPSVVPKLSLENGLVYIYTKPPRADGLDGWFLTALDFRDGKTVYSRLAGSGFGYNNNYAPITLSPDGATAYVGVLGGLVAFR